MWRKNLLHRCRSGGKQAVLVHMPNCTTPAWLIDLLITCLLQLNAGISSCYNEDTLAFGYRILALSHREQNLHTPNKKLAFQEESSTPWDQWVHLQGCADLRCTWMRRANRYQGNWSTVYCMVACFLHCYETENKRVIKWPGCLSLWN